MSRSGYSDDLNSWDLIRWRGRVASAIRGKRGQQLLVDLETALVEMEVKELIANSFADEDGVCALGAVAKHRGVPRGDLPSADDLEDYGGALVGRHFNIADCMAQEIMFENDERGWNETPADRHTRVLNWVRSNIKRTTNAPN